MYKLNKFKYSRRLYLKCICSAVFVFIKCCCAEVVVHTAAEFYHYANEVSWRAHASNYANNTEVKGWFKHEKYKESIFKVMAQAIADCVKKKAEFANYNESTKVVEFAGTEPKGYSAENWNAVVLWNFLAYVIDARYEQVSLNSNGVTKVGEILKTHYKRQYDKQIGEAIQDIQAYANDLGVYDYIAKLTKVRRHKDKYAPGAFITRWFNEEGRSGEFAVYGTYVFDKGNAQKTPLIIKVCGGKVVECGTKFGFYEQITWDMRVENKKPRVQPTQNFNDGLLKQNEIRNLTNFGKDPITHGRCYFNSTMQCLNASSDYRDTVNFLASKAKVAAAHEIEWEMSTTLSKFVTNGAAKAFDNETEYAKALKELAEKEDNYGAFRSVRSKRLGRMLRGEKTPVSIQQEIELYRSFARLGPGGANNPNEVLCSILLPLVEELRMYSLGEQLCSDDTMTHNEQGEAEVCDESVVWMEVTQNVASIKKYLSNHFDLKRKRYNDHGEDFEIRTRILRLPKILLVYISHKQEEVFRNPQVPDTLTLNDTEGEKKYRLVSAVTSCNEVSNHAKAYIRTKQGWFSISDLSAGKKNVDAYYKPDSSDVLPARDRIILLYQMEG